MTVFVDTLMHHGAQKGFFKGKQSCHMVTDQFDFNELHLMAAAIGMQRAWFQTDSSIPHYDLVESRRKVALAKGAKEISRKDFCLLIDRYRVHCGKEPFFDKGELDDVE